MTPLEHLEGLWGISLCASGLFGLYISIRIERFIVKRYEEETDLLNTAFFRDGPGKSVVFPEKGCI